MVTITIKQQDVHPAYTYMPNWIRYGISNSAVEVFGRIYQKNNPNKNYLLVRNKDDKHKQPVNKW